MPTDTFTITTDAADGGCRRDDLSWGTITGGGGTFYNRQGQDDLAIFKKYVTADTRFYSGCGCMQFDTSSIPDDANISSADLKVYVIDVVDTDGEDFAADFYDFGGGALDTGDWEITSSGNAIATIDPTGLSVGSVNTIALTGLTGISKTGMTGIRIAAKDTSQPSGGLGTQIDLATNEHLTAASPQLLVTYTTVTLDNCLPDADITTTGWTTAPLFSKVNDASDATVIQATAV